MEVVVQNSMELMKNGEVYLRLIGMECDPYRKRVNGCGCQTKSDSL